MLAPAPEGETIGLGPLESMREENTEFATLGKDFYFWNDPRLKKSIPEDLERWVGRDLTRAVPTMLLRLENMEAELKALTGPLITWQTEKKNVKIRVNQLVKVLIFLLAALGLGVSAANVDLILAGLLFW